MKIREGFVSNSSSSSFIIGIANATQAGRNDVGDVFNPEWAQYSKNYGCYILDLDGDYTNVYIHPRDDGTYDLTVDSFDDTEVSCNASIGDKILVVNGIGPDEDSYFWEEESGYYNYDKIDFDDFDKEDQEKIELILSLGGRATYGAGRNG